MDRFHFSFANSDGYSTPDDSDLMILYIILSMIKVKDQNHGIKIC